MNLPRLLSDRVIARLITPEKSDGGIVLPECAGNTAEHRLATVLAVGLGRRGKNGEPIPHDVPVGARVVMDFSGGWINLDGELLIMANAHNVLAVLEEEK